MTTVEIVRRDGLAPTTLAEARELATQAAASGLFPVKRPEEALVILLTGRELGLAPMAALRGIYVVNGRPVLSADLMVAVVRRSGLCRTWRVVESTVSRCEITTQRTDEEHPASRVWTLEDAKRAGVTGKGVWAQYPAAMLRHRCAADLAREVYPEVVLGLYDPEELDATPRDAARAEVIPESPTPAVDALADFTAALAECATLDTLAACWKAHSRALESAERLTAAKARAADHLAEQGYDLTSAELTSVLACTMSPALAGWYDVLARTEGAAGAVDALRSLPALSDEDTKAAKRAVSRIVQRALGLSPKAAGEWIAARLHPTDPEPPTGTDAPPVAPSTPASATSTPVATVASAQPSAVVTVDGEVLETADAWRAHLSAMVSPQAVEGSYRRHRDHMAYAALAVQRYMLMRGIRSAETARVALESAARALDNRDARKGAVVALPTPRNVVEGLGIERQRRAVGQ